ncbi:MAG: Cobalamin (vitamin B12)-binding protein [Myxococcaceae bacterium]|nr:Cobalamin (vitamin B12)-binding protein [Myxococcaceae bacterium]
MFEFSLPSSALELTVPYLRAVLDNDSAEAVRLALEEGLARGIPAPALQLSMIMPAQREVGRLWQENVISVAQEHLATSISQLVMSKLYPHLPRSAPNGLRALVACVPGELHDVGARMGADFLEMAGFDVEFLGTKIPTASLLTKVRDEHPHLLGLSATMHFHLPALRALIEQVRSVTPLLPIVVGGGVLDGSEGLASELGVQAFGDNAEKLAEQCQRMLAR